MSEFLVAIPRLDRSSFEGQLVPQRNQDRLARIAEGYSRFLGPAYGDEPRISSTAGQGTAAVLSWTRTGEPERVRTQGDLWTVTAGTDAGAELLQSLTLRGGRLLYETPVWGQYATVVGERYLDRVTAWNTVPALEAIHYAVADDYVFISNRPLLAALGLVSGVRSAVQLDLGYLSEYLHFGYSISGLTPFTGVRTIPADRALAVRGGEPRLVDLPAGLTGSLASRHSVEEGAEALADALQSAMDRSQASLEGRPLQLRMSGGKDSRLLLGLLRGRDIEVRALTYGQEIDGDVQLARTMTAMTGTPHSVEIPELAAGDALADQVGRTVFESGGLPPSEPHTSRYRGADPRRPGEAIMLGQWPLTKGGLAKRMRYTPEGVEDRVLKQGGALLNASARAPHDEMLRGWLADVQASSDLEKLYLFARQFRSGRYLQAHVAHYSRDGQLAYPISDAQVADVCDTLSMLEKVSEKALFGALGRIWPEVLGLPLDRSTWRFESGGKDEAYSGALYEARSTPLPPVEAPAPSGPRRPSEFSTTLAVQLATEILGSDRAPVFASLLSDDVFEALILAAAGNLAVPEGMNRMEMVKYFWRIYAADVWLSRAWLDL
ncbi:hypothetical protein ACQ7DA_07855 [Zafaria sp. J156]|uniref:hypothetical protein n=1 Tax=Zafaria sp. J156 TaxID=3116490 RepID=UPI002E78F213|nr:hypothetical protein [Zafaria sp. J156]MEE1620714.1 hypothetical protein [Zafaria sp. J156]